VALEPGPPPSSPGDEGGSGRGETAPSESALAWHVLPARAPARTVALVAAYAVAFALGALLLRSPWAGIVGLLLVFGATAEYWLGERYRVDPQGARRRVGLSTSEIAWSEVVYAGGTEEAVLLSPLKGGTRSQFRGVWLRTMSDADHRESVLGYVRAHLPEGAEDALP
jgi:hypothetical protein